jgi:hypothetical protein
MAGTKHQGFGRDNQGGRHERAGLPRLPPQLRRYPIPTPWLRLPPSLTGSDVPARRLGLRMQPGGPAESWRVAQRSRSGSGEENGKSPEPDRLRGVSVRRNTPSGRRVV